MRVFILILFISTTVISQNYQVSLNFPFLIDNNKTNIKYIGSDFSDNFLVSLENGQGRRYDSTFTSYVNFSMPEAATLLSGKSKTINGFISQNGSLLTSKGQMITSISNQQSTVRDYAYGDLNLLENYTVIDKVNYNYLLPLNISNNIQGLHFLYCQNSFKIGIDGTIVEIVDFYPSGGQNYDVEFKSQTFSVSLNLLNITVVAYLAQSANEIYQNLVTVQLQYDPSLNKFSLLGVQNKVNTLLMTTSFQGTSLFMANGLLLIQNKSSGNTAMYNTLASTVGTVSGFSSSETLLFFFIFNQYYALQTNGLAVVNFNSGSNSLTFFSLTIPLLQNFYGLSPGNVNVDPFYIVDQPYVYKSGRCPGQTLLGIGGICITYSCLLPYCSSCPFTALTCGVCQEGYYKSSLLLCSKDTTSQSSSNTPSNNPTISQNTTKNQNYSSSNGTSSNSDASNNQYVVIYFMSEQLWNKFVAFVNQLLGCVKKVISIPAARRVVSPLFCYFGIFDDIYLYQFHDRVYGPTMNGVFDEINDIQVSKWSIFTYENIITFFNGNPTQFDKFINYQSKYLSYNWADSDHTYLGNEGLIGNSQNFFIVAIPLVFLAFVLFRIIFKILSNYPISKLFRKFDFWVFYPILLFEGNIEQFSFFTTRDLMNMFSFDLSHKILKVIIIFFGMIVLLYSCSIYLLGYIMYKKLNNYFSDNNRNNLKGCTLLIFQNGLKNMLLGSLQAILRPLPYGLLISVLVVTEIFFLIIFLMSIRMKIYKSYIRIWIYILVNALKMFLLFSLYWDYHNVNIPSSQEMQQIVISLITICFCLGIIIEMSFQIYQCKQSLEQLFCRLKRREDRKYNGKFNKFQQEQVQKDLKDYQRATKKKKKIRLDSFNTVDKIPKTSLQFIKEPKSNNFQDIMTPKMKYKNVLQVPRNNATQLSKYMLYKVVGSSIATSASSLRNSYTWEIEKQK